MGSVKGKTSLLLAAENGHKRTAYALMKRRASVKDMVTDALGLPPGCGPVPLTKSILVSI